MGRAAPDASAFVAKALSPAQVIDVRIDEEHRIANVVVPERMLSLAIGREGQNARLAAKLTGWRVDIRKNETEMPGISPHVARFARWIRDAGWRSSKVMTKHSVINKY